MTYLFALVNIALLIIVHEFGHLVVAKLCGVAVPVFSVGFGRRLVGVEIGGTDYRLSSIPFGGYVRMAGSDPYGYFEEGEEHIDPEKGFLRRPLWQRIAILLAGPAANVFFAIAVICVVLMIGDEHPTAEVGLVRPDTPAEQAGFRPGDEIVEVGGVEVQTWNQAMAAFSRLEPGTTTVAIRRDDNPVELSVTVESPDASASRRAPDFGLRNPRPVPLIGVDDPASPAGMAGLETGWLIKKVGDVEVRDWVALNRALRALDGASGVEVVVAEPNREARTWEDRTLYLERGSWAAAEAPGTDDAAGWGMYPAVLFVQRVSDTVSDSYGFLSACRPAAPPRDSPARLAGVASGDHLLAIDGRPLLEWADVDVGVRSTLSPDAAPTEPPRVLTLDVRRNGELVSFEIQPEVIADQDNTGMNQVRAIIGVGGAGYAVAGPTLPIPYPAGDALMMSVEQNVEMARLSVERIGHLLVGAAAFDQSLGGPVAMFTTGAMAAEAGLFSMAKFAAAISLSLGVVNLFPIPVLDGGQILFFLIEAVRGRPLSAAMRERVLQVAVLGMVLLMLAVTVKDVNQFISYILDG
ncbi:MAG: RIP metalloprotease RseP [Deltaproteobacteria bacterium]|nr:RIP metalloprotease RseP [Deltaproteobacteria bacterium]